MEELSHKESLTDTEAHISGEKSVIYCVLTRIEISELRRIVEEYDDSAFVTITDVSEVIGNHIKNNTKLIKETKEDKNI